MPRAMAIIVFLLLVGEDPSIFAGLMSTPAALVEEVLFAPSPIKLPLFTWAALVLLMVLGAGPSPHMRARPMAKALLVSVSCAALWTVLGVTRGGSLYQTAFQLFPLLNGLLLAALLMAVAHRPQHYAMILKAIVAAAVYRALAGLGLYVFMVRDLPWDKVPEYLTAHGDTVLYVSAVLILLVGAVERATPKARLAACFLVPILLLAIHLNNRRLAWVSLVAGLVAVYAAYPPSASKRRVVRAAAVLLPVLGLYTAIGWGRSERIFKPLRSLESVGSDKDASTLSRDFENEGLLFTFAQYGFLGAGFGIEYIEINTSLSARVFAQYRYSPHNSLLGLLAFTGPLGLAGILMPLPISIFLNARTSRAARAPLERVVAVVGVAEAAVCLNQLWGDMGFISRTTLTVLATAIAAAGRLSVWTGAFPSRAPASGAKGPAPPGS